MTFVCTSCGRCSGSSSIEWRCACGGLFALAKRLPFRPNLIESAGRTLWRYRAMLPLLKGAEPPLSLSEGWTPLLSIEDAGRRLWAKLEFLAPTGSFKDRGTSVLISALRAQGIQRVAEDSSGNAGASLAAYAARAGIEAQVCVPAHASPAKLHQIEVYGAKLIKVGGPRERASERAQQLTSEGSYYASHVYNPLILEGLKTFVYEIWEQLNGKLPHWLIYPTGNGTLLYGSYLGLCDLKEAGVIDRLPRLIAVQAENCAPLFAPFQGHLPTGPVAKVESARPTVAEGIAIRKPPRAEQILKALRETKGTVVTVSEDEIREAQQTLAHQGLYVEPTAAVALAGWRRLKDHIKPKEQVLLPLTGSGLKAL